MSDSYVECLVKAKQPAWAKILKVLLITLTVLSCLVTVSYTHLDVYKRQQQ